MVSADDVTDVTGGDTNPWKTGKTLTAFDICRNYEGDGFGDWSFRGFPSWLCSI